VGRRLEDLHCFWGVRRVDEVVGVGRLAGKGRRLGLGVAIWSGSGRGQKKKIYIFGP